MLFSETERGPGHHSRLNTAPSPLSLGDQWGSNSSSFQLKYFQDKLKTEILEEEEGLLDQKISMVEDLGSCTNPLLLGSKIR